MLGFNMEIARLQAGKTARSSSWSRDGRNQDCWSFKPGEKKILADIKGPGCITHIWMTQEHNYREMVLSIYWDDLPYPSVLCPLGDFFCLGHGIVNSFQSLLFTASTNHNNRFNQGCALNCYAPMPFRKRARVELWYEKGKDPHQQYFYIDYEKYDGLPDNAGYFHAEFRRENPFGGWGHEIPVIAPEANIASNKEQLAWDNNYVILETKGRGHYAGCNISVSNLQRKWWGEGDDMIWVDGYKWPPDLHGTGSEDYLNQAWGMQNNAFLRNGSSIHEKNTNGYQTSYVFHLENPVRFQREIKVTIEHGHGNHLANEMCSVAYWYAERPTEVRKLPTVEKRLPVMQDLRGKWVLDKRNQTTSRIIKPNAEMLAIKRRWKKRKSK